MINQWKTNKKHTKKLVEISRYHDYTTGNLLDYSYHQNYYKLINIDLSRETQSFLHKLISKENDGVTMFLIAERQQKTILNFSLD